MCNLHGIFHSFQKAKLDQKLEKIVSSSKFQHWLLVDQIEIERGFIAADENLNKEPGLCKGKMNPIIKN